MKPIKVLYNGKRLKDVYPYATRWQVFKHNMMRRIRKTTLAILTVGFILGVYQMGEMRMLNFKAHAQNISSIAEPQDTLKEKVNELENDLLDSLSACESAGRKEDDNTIVFDTNAKASIGVFQFQITTVQHYAKLLQGKELKPREAIYLALDGSASRELAREIIFTQKRGLENWHNCANKKGLYTQLEIINKLKN